MASNRTKYAVIATFVVVIAAYFSLAFKARGDAGGLSSSTSPVYWVNRITGKDLFDEHERIWYKGVRERKEVCLTIDDGPHPVSCIKLLDVCKEKGVKAAFFVVGKQVDGNPDLVKRMIEEGHEVCNHTYNHVRLDSLSREQVFEEFKQCDDAVERAANCKMTLVRPPGMRFNNIVLDVVRQREYLMVHWTIGAKDFIGSVPDYELTPELKKMPKATPELIVERVVKQLKPGAIILLHDNPITAEAMPALIDAVRAQGYEFSTCQEMLRQLPHQVIIDPNPGCEHVTVSK